MIADETLFLSIRELGEQIRARKLSVVDLTEAYLQRSERLGPKLNAYATLTRSSALSRAREADRDIAAGRYRGPLHGIPYAPKDLLAARGAPTTWGARPYASQQFDYDATVIDRLNNAGAIMIGKAAMIELAGGLGYTSGQASLTGPCRNPWNTDYWTCGSSSGSGAVMGAALAAFTLGSDTRGSIICPSTHCGISGMRPSFGRVSRHGSMAIAWSMDKIGPMARTADCCGLILAVIAGHDPLDHDSLPAAMSSFTYGGPPAPRPLRIGRLTNVFPKADAAIHNAVRDALGVLEKNGAHVEDAQLPDGPFEEAAELTILMESASAFADLLESGRCAELADPHGRINGYASAEFSTVDYLRVQRVRTILQKRIDALFDRFDVIAAPGQGETAFKLSSAPEDEPDLKTPVDSRQPDAISSLCGLPAITVPCGFSKDKLPLGIQFMGRALDDEAVIAAANLFQAHTDWHRRRPPLT